MSLPSGILQRLAGVLISICLIACPVLAQSLEVIDLKYRTAAEVIPVLQPLLEQGGALTGQDYKLFVRTSPANLRQLRAALEQIDRKPNQLLVSVRRSTEQEIQRERAQVSGTVSNRGADVSVRATESNARDRSSGIASVQVIEGSSALISSGSDVPIVTSVAAGRRTTYICRRDDQLSQPEQRVPRHAACQRNAGRARHRTAGRARRERQHPDAAAHR